MKFWLRIPVWLTAILLWACAALGQSGAGAPANDETSLPAMATEEIVARLEERNQQRATTLRGYSGKRLYELRYHGFPSGREAQMEVVVHYEAPDRKSFEVVQGSGSKMIQNKVFARLLESEREAAQEAQQRATALSHDNYRFTLLGARPSEYGGCYRLAVEPKRDSKFLYRGEVCVNATDFAVESIDAEPAHNPSFWIRRTHIEHRYQKIGDFWLPLSNLSISNVRLGGEARLRISYLQYELH